MFIHVSNPWVNLTSYGLLFPSLRSHSPEIAELDTPDRGLQRPKTPPLSHTHVQQLEFQKVAWALAQDSQMVSLQAARGHTQMSQD